MKAESLTVVFIFYSLLVLATTRRIELRFRSRPKKVNVDTYPSTQELRSLDDLPNEEFPTVDEDEEEIEPEFPIAVSAPTNRKKLLLVKGPSNDVNTGRTFKHLLLLRGFGDSNYGSDHDRGSGHGGGGHGYGSGGGGHGYGSGGGNGGGSGSGGAIFYLYNPLNLTNINNNTLLNEQPTMATGGAGRITFANGGYRDAPEMSYLSNAQALPQAMQISQPTPVYQQRDEHSNNNKNQMPFNLMMPALVGMLGQNGEVVPMMLPQLGGDFQSLMRNNGNRRNVQRRRGGNRNSNSPFMNFRDNLKNFQFFQ